MNPKSSNLPVITASHQKYNCYPMTNVPKSKNKFYQANNQTFKPEIITKRIVICIKSAFIVTILITNVQLLRE